MKRLSRSILILGISALLVLPKKVARACGFYIWPGEYRFWLMQPDLSNEKDLSPFFLSTTGLYTGEEGETTPLHYEQNIQEWLTIMGNKTNARDIDSILYHTEPTEFLSHPNRLAQKNTFAALLIMPRNKRLLQYMRLAKKVEGLAARPDPWQENHTPNANIDELIEEAAALYAATNNTFIRLRIAYQLLRLHGRNGETEAVRKVYEEKVRGVRTNSWIKEAAMYEFAINNPGVERYYLLSRVFDQSAYNREHCLLQFHGALLKYVLPLAANDHERTVLYAMRAFRDPGRTLHNIKYIYSRDPGYKEIPFLLLREINKVEDWLLTNKVTGLEPAMDSWVVAREERDMVKNYQRDLRYTNELYEFVKHMLAKKKHKAQALLQLCAAHLAFIQGKNEKSRQHLAIASRMPGLPANIKTQLLINDLLLRLEADTVFGKATENKLMHLLQMPAQKLGVHSPGIMKDQLILYAGKKLIRNGQRAKGLLLLGKTRRALGELSIDAYKSIYEEMWETATAADYDEILRILQKEQPSAFERFVAKGTLHTPGEYYEWSKDEPRKKWDINKLLDLKAGWYIRQDSLEQALTVLTQIPTSFWKQDPYDFYVSGDPFYLNIYHAHKPEPGEKNYNKTQVIEGMIRLKKQAVQDNRNAPLYYYKLANAYYNLTYHGKLWIMSKPWSSVEDVSEYADDLHVSRFNDIYYGCSRAKEYYLKALKQTTDKKLASLSAYMTRHCEQHFQEYRAMSVFKKEAGKLPDPYPELLKQEGFGSDYYKELIDECATYNSFVAQLHKQ